MKFIAEVKAPTSCKARSMARALLYSWSRKNGVTVYIVRYSVGHTSTGKKVTIEANVENYEGEQVVYL